MASVFPESDERRQLRRSVATLTGRYGHGYFVERARRHEEPTALWKELGSAGFLGVHLPEAYGGGGGGLTDLAVVIEELSAGGCPLLMTVISPAICGSIIARHGSEELKQRWLPGIVDGSHKMAFAITEPDAGSNSHQITTTAHPDGKGWRLSGTKYWTSGIDEADAVLVVARDPAAGPDGRRPLSLFVVPTDAAGLSYQVIEAALVAPERQFTVFLDDVTVGPQALIGAAGNGLRQVFAALAEAYIAMQQARLMTARAAELFDAGDDAAEAANIAKFAAADASLQALDQAIQTHGGNGLALEYGLADLWFLARMLRTAPVSREMVLNFVAQHSLGLPASY